METVKIVFGGDVMLGRNVGKWIERCGPDYPLGKIAPIMQSADLSIINLECAITSSNAVWEGERKAFYFGAPVQASTSLVHAGVDAVSLANNHVLDFGHKGLEDTLRFLDDAGIGHAGAGRDLFEASSPILVERRGISFGMAAFCDHQADFSAGRNRSGINYVALDAEEAALDRFREGLERIGRVDWPVLSLHWGPNMVHRPSRQFVRLAHAAIEMGYGMVYGHSAHVFHGVEIYKGKPICYSCGDLVDDYYVDEDFGNDRQLLFELEVSGKRVEKMRFHPVFIEDCRAVPATAGQKEYIAKRIASLSGELGTQVLELEAILPTLSRRS